MISFNEAWRQVKGLNLSKERAQIVTDSSQSFLSKIFGACFAARLPTPLLAERDQIMSFAKVQFNDQEDLHFKMLSTIYKVLTGTTQAPNRIGSHWETIGFQGSDPATDLRGVGMLGILQILAYVTFHKEFMQKVFEYLRNPSVEFPLCACLLGVTKIVLQTLRDQKLNTLISMQKSVINVVNNYYFAVFFRFFMYYKLNNLTVQDYGRTFTRVTDECKGNPTMIINDFNESIQHFGIMLFE